MCRAGQYISLICGSVFLLVGVVFTGTGVWLLSNQRLLYHYGTGDVIAMLCILLLLGVLLVTVGSGLFVHRWRQAREKQRLLEEGFYVTATITDVIPDFRTRVNYMPTYKVKCTYYDSETGACRVFYSDNILCDPSDFPKGMAMHVYVSKHEYKTENSPYYVDVESIFPSEGT